jgi:hypothetical protein
MCGAPMCFLSAIGTTCDRRRTASRGQSELQSRPFLGDSRRRGKFRCGDRARISAPSANRRSGGNAGVPGGRISDLLQALVRFVAAAPDEMSVVGMVIPSERGARFQILVFHCGDSRRGNDLLGPLRSLNPSQDSVRVAEMICSARCDRSIRHRTAFASRHIWKPTRPLILRRLSHISKQTCFFQSSVRQRLRR